LLWNRRSRLYDHCRSGAGRPHTHQARSFINSGVSRVCRSTTSYCHRRINVHKVIRFFVLVGGLFFLSACTPMEPGIYRGGVLLHEGPLDIQDRYSFRFVDKWRISFSWLSGPVASTRDCPSLWSNSFRDLQIQSELNLELNPPLVEKNHQIYALGENKGIWSLFKSPRRDLRHESRRKICRLFSFLRSCFKRFFGWLSLAYCSAGSCQRHQ